MRCVVTELTVILQRLEQGDPHAANELLPLVYEELRRLGRPEDGAGKSRSNVTGHGAAGL